MTSNRLIDYQIDLGVVEFKFCCFCQTVCYDLQVTEMHFQQVGQLLQSLTLFFKKLKIEESN
jgi:hypothetical protein